MKKNLFLLAGIMFSFGAFAQSGFKRMTNFTERPATVSTDLGSVYDFSNKTSNNQFTAKAGGDVLWSEDFSDGTDWTLNNNGQTGADFGWALVTSTRSWAAPNYGIAKQINSTSGGQFLDVVNGKYNNANPTSAINVTYTATSPAITIANPNVTVSFQQYGAEFNDSQIMQVSTDGTTFVKAYSNDDVKTSYNGSNPSAIYPNPDNVLVNLGTLGLDPTATTLYIRFVWTSRFPSESSPMAWLGFGWMIDDINVLENYANDLKVGDPIVSSAGIRYSIIPSAQAQTVGAFNALINNGSGDLANAKSIVTITTPDGSNADTLAANLNPIPAYAADTIGHEVQLATEGTYTVSNFNATADGTDEQPANNASPYTYSFQYGGDIYALDLGAQNQEGYDYEQDNAEFHIGNVFDMYADADLTGIDVYLYASGNLTSTPGTEIFGTIRNYDNDYTAIQSTPTFEISADQNNKWTTLVFDEPVHLTANTTYFATVGTYGSGADPNTSNDLVVGFSGQSLRGTSLAYYGSQQDWFIAGSGGTPMVRMNFTPGLVSTKNLSESVKVNIYPNPAKDVAVVDYNTAFDGDVTISVVDMSGRTVYNKTFANQAKGNNKVELNVNDFNAGVYTVVIAANSSRVTKKLVVK